MKQRKWIGRGVVFGGLVYLVIKYRQWFAVGIALLYLVSLKACQPKLSTAPAVQCFEDTIDLTPLKYAMCTDKTTYQYGEAVQISFAVTNMATYKVTLDGGDKPALDIQLSGVGEWSAMHPAATATQIPLAAGAVYTIEWRWIPEQAYLESIRQERYLPSSKGIDAIIRYKPYDVRDYWSLSIDILPDDPAPVPATNQLRGHCTGEQRAAGDLELQLCTDKRDYQYGEPVQIRWQIRNISDSPIVLDGGAAAAMDIHIVEWELPAGEAYPVAVGEERRSDAHPFETQIELAPGEVHLVEWQWPTEQTDFDAVLEYMRVPEAREVAQLNINGDYFLQPGNRWSFKVRIDYTVENNE
ncbi:MAG: hypothetical protein JXA33_21030 [Anaerolineae bacterium]|nr:hypothetical protein [Anaerolineae bacterium]